jgi:uncharacterized membrane protein YhaH (DUF805 family)
MDSAPTPSSSSPQSPDTESWLWIFLSLRGRLSRRGFWRYGVGGLLLASVYLTLLAGIVGLSRHRADLLANLVLLVPAVAVSAKRWQDRDRSPWWVLVALIPVVGWLWALLDNGFVRGTPGANRFGPPPSR